MTYDLFFLLQWWLSLFILGALFFPLTSSLIPRFVDRGYGLTKIVGMIFLSYAVMLLGTVRLIPFNHFGLFFIFVILVIGSILFLKATQKFSFKKTLLPFLQKNWLLLALEELFFLGILLLWGYIRSHAPDINGLEKFMDYGFINSVLRSNYFPAPDMWLAPFSINYYYFGHITTAVLTKFSLLPSHLTYNLMLATIAALCFSASFSIGATLLSFIQKEKMSVLRSSLSGLLTAMLITFAGNLHSIYSLFKAYPNESPVPFWELVFSPFSFPNAYWYPNATRFIYNTIHEFPIYSWTVSDLHGHVLDIPFVLLVIAVLLSFFLKLKDSTTYKKIKLLKIRTWTYDLGNLLLISFLLAVLYMTNAWDGIIYLMLAGIILLYINWQKVKDLKQTFLDKVANLIFALIPSVLILGFGFVIFSLPFSLFFKPFVSGIGIICAPEFLTNIGQLGPFLFEPEHCQRSPIWQLAILHGFFYFFITFFLIFLAKTKKLFSSDIFVLLLIILSTLLILIPEFAYMKDIYPAHYRANTMFKLVFQSFIMLSISVGYIIVRINQHLKYTTKNLLLYIIFILVTTLLLLVVLIYPYFSVMSYYGDLKTYKGLNGITYLQDKYPNDYEAIKWLNENIDGQPIILEAQGDSYTDYARVSSNTGLPTILGWTVHEWLWRGSYDIPSPRIEEIKTMYESEDISLTRDLLQKHNVEYIFLGDLEREKYSNLNEDKFEQLGKIIFQKGQTKILKIEL